MFAGLSEQQSEIVRALRGPVLVKAGAGTGKTTAITHRIAHGVQTGVYQPSRVLALTFTAKAAHELRQRLARLGASGVSARTFHAAALAQLNFFWPQVAGGHAPKLLGGKAALISQAADSLKLRLSSDAIRDCAGEIEWRKVQMLTVEQYQARLAERELPAGLTVEQLLELHTEYERHKDARRSIDFEDVLLATAGLIAEEERVALQVREQYRFFTVDEYQDVSPLQHALLKVWLGDRSDLCVVGDASQTIYSFAGASNGYLLSFTREFPNAQTFELTENYRSSAAVVTAANDLMAKRPGALKLQPMLTGEAEPIRVIRPKNEADEAEVIATHIAAALNGGAAATDFAVLTRTNAQSGAFESAFAAAGVPYQVNGGVRFFDRPAVKRALISLKGASLADSGEPLYQQVGHVLRAEGWSVKPPSGAAQRESWEALNALYLLADEAEPEVTLTAFTNELLERARSNIEPNLSAVTLSAIHAVKGLEFANVFLAGCVSGLIPISYAKTDAQIEEERRLLYVALTRAKRSLVISAPLATGAGVSRAPSPFLGDLREVRI